MAINERIREAFFATRALGIPDQEVKPVLKHLLKLFDNKWELIESEDYRALIDAYFELKEDKGVDDQDIVVVEHGESSRLPKRLCLQEPEDQASSTKGSGSQILSSEENEKPVVNLQQGVTFLNKKDSSSSGCSNSCNKVQQQQLVTCEKKRPFLFISDVTKGMENVKISLVDEIGKQDLPKFTYMRDNVIYQDAYVHISMARVADEHCCSGCLGDCLSVPIPCACAHETGGEFAYTTEGLLREEFLRACISMKLEPQAHHFVYCYDCPLERLKNENKPEKCKGHLVRKFIKECWRKCGCNMQCGNRVVQRGIVCKLQVFWTPEGKGWGVKTLRDLPKGTFVCEYVGEILTNTELHERNTKGSGNAKHTYPVTLDADWGSEKILKDEEALCLDATFCGNVARFINHRCFDANLIDIPVEVETPDRHYYHLALFTTRYVRASEELTWDYGIDFNDRDHPIKAFECCCGRQKPERPYIDFWVIFWSSYVFLLSSSATETEPLLHKDFLCYDLYKNQESNCDKCGERINGWAYSCENCEFWVHESCAEQQLRPQVSNLLHPELQLALFCEDSESFLCDQCFYISRGHRYRCKDCSFNLDLTCSSSSINDQRLHGQSQSSKTGERIRIQHFSHEHPLYLFNYRRIGKKDYICSWCDRPLSVSDISWDVLNFAQTLLFSTNHVLVRYPEELNTHFIHHIHLNLELQYNKDYFSCCSACKGELHSYPCQNYCCFKCKFWLHVFCIRTLPTLKHSSHEHDLAFFIVQNRKDFKCNHCDKNCNAGAEWSILNPSSWLYGASDCAFYRCVQCDLNFHLSCISIPRAAKHRYHRHPLFLKDSIKEDDSGEYYCDICEEGRSSEHHVYYCENCSYVAHIECALAEEKSGEVLPSRQQYKDTTFDLAEAFALVDSKAAEQDESRQSYAEFKKPMLHFSHHHDLSFNEIIDDHKNLCCNACEMEIRAPAYVCGNRDRFCLHETCAKLSPYVKEHLLHSKHPLELLIMCPTNKGIFICDECGDISRGFVYFCRDCEFKLDRKCAAPTTSKNGDQKLKRTLRESKKKSHFSHDHMLVLANCRLYVKKFRCNGCYLPIIGAAYCCLDCSYSLHESCLELRPRMTLLFHPEDPLLPNRQGSLSFGNVVMPADRDSIGLTSGIAALNVH